MAQVGTGAFTAPAEGAPGAGASARRPRIAVLIPCRNEAATVARVVTAFRAAEPSATIYVYDNDSTDGTGRLAEEAGAIVVREPRRGKGFVVRSMFRDVEADCYVMVDGDDTYPADEAAAMCTEVLHGGADMVIGDRLSTTYFTENRRRFHGAGNRLVRFLVNRIFSSDVHDIMTGCRCFSRRFVKSFPVLSGGFEIETEMTIHALDKNFVIREVPISYRDRGDGSRSKVSTVSDGIKVLKTIFELFRDYRPLLFFSSIALVLFVVSSGMFWVPLDEYLRTGWVSKMPTLIVAITLGISAMLALVCGVLLDSIRTHARQFYELALTRIEDSARREDADEAC